jgi:hypothetical protein
MKRWSVVVLRVVGVVVVTGCGRSSAVKDDAAPPLAATAAPVLAAPEKSVDEKVAESVTLPAALAFARPEMADSLNRLDHGTLMLAVWSARHLRWSDVTVAPNETSFGAAMKDPDEARGRRMCVSGALIEIEIVKTTLGKLWDGLFQDYAQNLYKFSAAGSSGELVAESPMRFCGIVTGKYDYSNSGGGTGHAIKIVGMFDLPANRTTSVATPAPAGARPVATTIAKPVESPADPTPPKAAKSDRCNPPFTTDETGRKKYKLECL